MSVNFANQTEPARQPQVPSQIGQLEKSSHALLEIVEKLSLRLDAGGVLRASPPERGGPATEVSAPRQVLVEIAEQVSGSNERIILGISRIEGLFNRLEV